MNKLRVGIIGAGWIADKIGQTLRPMEDATGYAIASRDLSKAQAFAEKYGFEKTYGSYEELCADPNVDLVYIATPHSHHYAHTKLALEHNKPVLVEKAFTANAREAEELLNIAHEKKIFITEAIWTRYQPLKQTILDIMASGIVGKPRLLNASLCYQMEFKERIIRPDLCGGALLDLGVYSINFARMFFGTDIEEVISSCVKNNTGMDMHDSIILKYKDGRVANIQASACCKDARRGVIACDYGYLEVDNINNPQSVTVYNDEYQEIAHYDAPTQITGYEYQVSACAEALHNGWLESPYMPHEETLEIMKMMDALRKEWGVVYPMD